MEINLFGRALFLNKGIIAVILVILTVVLGGTGYAINNSRKSIVIESPDDKAQNGQEAERPAVIGGKEGLNTGGADEVKKEESISVYIVGCVKNPGIYSLKKGQLIFDAINAAGGAGEDADLENINMAYKLQDNVMLRIASKKEIEAGIKASYGSLKETSKAQAPVKDKMPAGKAVIITTNSKGAVAGEQSGEDVPDKVNINTADEKQLDSLPGVGAETVKDIIAFREKNGSFNKPEDIMKVPGIKTSKFNKIKDMIVAQ